MPMLECGGVPFSVGRARYFDGLPTTTVGSSARVYVRIAVEGIDEPLLALVDTGAEWSVLDREIAEVLGLTDAEGVPSALNHRGGTTPGKLVRTVVTLLADEGDALAVEATVFVPDQNLPFGRNFIGYSSFLDQVKLGIDPQQNDIYFGGY